MPKLKQLQFLQECMVEKKTVLKKLAPLILSEISNATSKANGSCIKRETAII
jgi:hypothetical protein